MMIDWRKPGLVLVFCTETPTSKGLITRSVRVDGAVALLAEAGRLRILLLPPAAADVSTEWVGVIGLALTLSPDPMSQTFTAAASPGIPIPWTSPVTLSNVPARLSAKMLSISTGLL